MTLSINSKGYFNDIRKVRKVFLSKYDSILYPQINNDTNVPIYFHINGQDLENSIFQFNQKYEWREKEEVVSARSLPKTEIKYFNQEKHILEIQNKKHGSVSFHAKVVHPSTYEKFNFSMNTDSPPLFLVKRGYVIGLCSNPFLEGFDELSTAIDMYNSEIVDFNYNYIYKRFIKIKVLKSVLSKIENLDFKLDKRYILSSPYLDKGLGFFINESIYALWKDEKYLYVQVGKRKFFPTLLSFELDNLPQQLSFESILLLISSKLKDNSVINTMFKLSIENTEYPLVRQLHNLTLLASDNFVEVDSITNEGEYKFTNIQKHHVEDCIKALIYCICLNTPEMRAYVKGGNSSKIPFNTNNINKYIVKRWSWGDDKVRYIYPKRESNSKKIIHYTKPHLCKFYIKNLEKFKEYNPIEENGKYSIIKWREGCWKGNLTYIMGKQVGGYSRKAIRWLNHISKKNNIEIQHAENGGELRIELGNGKYYLVDGYCKDTNTVYEFHGDVFHGNPSIFNKEDKCHPYNDMTAGELLSYTIEKENNIKKIGFKLVTIWESEWDGKEMEG